MNEYDSSVYTVTVNVDENMDTFITFIKNGTNVDNSSEGVDEVEYYHLQSLSQSRRLPPLQVVNNSKFVSVGVRSPTEINAPRGCAVILIGICQLR